MSRIQLALNVSNLDDSIAFYSQLFGVKPAKLRPGYANFVIEEPSLKLVLIENAPQAGTLNHLGVEVATSAEVAAAELRLQGEGMETENESQVDCCYALQDKIWVTDPDRSPWEIYTVLDDSDTFSRTPSNGTTPACGTCC